MYFTRFVDKLQLIHTSISLA